MPPLQGQAAAVLPPALLGEACDAALRLPLVAVLQAPALVAEPLAAAAVQPALLAEPRPAGAVPQAPAVVAEPLAAAAVEPAALLAEPRTAVAVPQPLVAILHAAPLPVEAVGEPHAAAAAAAAAGTADRRSMPPAARSPARRDLGAKAAQLVLPLAAQPGLAIPPCPRDVRKSQRRIGQLRMQQEGERSLETEGLTGQRRLGSMLTAAVLLTSVLLPKT